MTDCSFDGCGRPQRAHDLCNGHCKQRRRGAELTPLRGGPKGRCSTEGCERQAQSLEWCRKHYSAQRRAAAAALLAEMSCGYESCDLPVMRDGYCRPHWGQWNCRGRDASRLTPVGEALPKPPPIGTVTRPRVAKPKSVLPPGWYNPTPAKPRQRPGPRPEPDVLLLDTNPPTDTQIAATRRLLARRGALDLADMLGVA